MMIQDIAPRKLDNQYDPAAVPEAEDQILVLCGSRVLVSTEPELSFPRVGQLGLTEPERPIYLFSVDEERFFLYPCAAEEAERLETDAFRLRDLKQIREESAEPKYRVFAALTAKHLADWYRDTRFCGRCGQRMAHSAKERAMVCPSCGYTAYPRIMPAVIVGVTNGDRLLLTRYARGFRHNALIAGFTEIGETLEQTVAREVMEEVGLRVKGIRYYRSQPWGIANDILMGFYCDVDGDDTITVDHGELRTAVWTRREDIELQPDRSSLTNEMMERFKDGLPC